MTEDELLEHINYVLDGTILDGAPLLLRDDGSLQIGHPDVDELAVPSWWRSGGVEALLEEAGDSRFGGLAGLDRGAFVVVNPLDAPVAWRWELVFGAFSNSARTLQNLPDGPAEFPW